VKKIVIACDHAGFDLKQQLKIYLTRRGLKLKDLGTYSKDSCDYPDFSYSLAKGISQGTYKKGILICKTGIGNSIVANRLPGVRAALCCNLKAARLSREHNDSNVLVLGSAFVNARSVKRIFSVWFNTKFQGGRHLRRLNKIKKIEKGLRYPIKRNK